MEKYSGGTGVIRYRIGYMALCIQNDNAGRQLSQNPLDLTKIDTMCIQLGSAGWFWERQLNPYVIQLEPDRSKNNGIDLVDFDEAVHIEKMKSQLFSGLLELELRQQYPEGLAKQPSQDNKP